MEEIKNLTELSRLLDLLRKKGVKSFKIGSIEMELRDEAPPSNYKRKLNDTAELKDAPTYSEEDALFWSSAGIPEEKAS